ncbi:DUF7524 family protein [Methanolacinia petrolearia]|uniref:DUF7524 family protein n=1 Tax=Methanolacinia petrolearia TaxID=54120 RepID=UPI003BABD4E5
MSVHIRLNRKGINSIEMPESADAEVGESLVLKMINHGAPLHLTVSTINGKRFTHFIHENLYVDDNLVLRIPILSVAPPGSFRIEIITGYGTVKEELTVNVHDQEIELPEGMEEIADIEEKKSIISGKDTLVILCAVLAWISYASGFFYPGLIPVIVPMVLLTAGVVLGWFFRSS